MYQDTLNKILEDGHFFIVSAIFLLAVVVIASINHRREKSEKNHMTIRQIILPYIRFFSIGAVLITLASVTILIAVYSYQTVFHKLSVNQDSTDFLTMLEVLLAFVGIVSVGIYFIVSKTIETENQTRFDLVKKESQSERRASRAENLLSESLTLSENISTINILKNLCDDCQDGTCSDDRHKERLKKLKERTISYLKYAIDLDKKAYRITRHLDLKNYSDVVVRSVNHLVCDLTDYYRTLEKIDYDNFHYGDIFGYAEELKSFLEDPLIQNNRNIWREDKIIYEETYRGVRHFFVLSQDSDKDVEEKEAFKKWLRDNKNSVSPRIYAIWSDTYDL